MSFFINRPGAGVSCLTGLYHLGASINQSINQSINHQSHRPEPAFITAKQYTLKAACPMTPAW
jgi:hypothetical protein